jgi:hypothetical protein
MSLIPTRRIFEGWKSPIPEEIAKALGLQEGDRVEFPTMDELRALRDGGQLGEGIPMKVVRLVPDPDAVDSEVRWMLSTVFAGGAIAKPEDLESPPDFTGVPSSLNTGPHTSSGGAMVKLPQP